MSRLFASSSNKWNGKSCKEQSGVSSEDVSVFEESINQIDFPKLETVSTVDDYVFIQFDELKNVLYFVEKILQKVNEFEITSLKKPEIWSELNWYCPHM